MADTPAQLTSPPKRSKRAKFDFKELRGPGYKPARQKEHPGDLPRWVKLAITEHETIGGTLEDAASKHGKAMQTLSAYNASPAGRKWRAEVKKIADSPERVAMSMIRASAANVAVDYLMALEGAIEAGDYREIGVMSRDLLDRLGIKKQNKENQQARPTLVINLGASSLALDMPMVESSATEVVEIDADYEVIDHDD